jgi:DNA invertase Pin-like site-specific DNA recombinase
VWKLDRLTRSLSDMLWLFERIHAAGAGFRSLTEAIDTTTPAGQMLAHMLGAFAQFERAMITERVRAGVQAAKARGVQLGRKPKLGYHQQQEAKRLIVAGQSQASVARLLDVDASTICRLVARAGA